MDNNDQKFHQSSLVTSELWQLLSSFLEKSITVAKSGQKGTTLRNTRQVFPASGPSGVCPSPYKKPDIHCGQKCVTFLQKEGCYPGEMSPEAKFMRQTERKTKSNKNSSLRIKLPPSNVPKIWCKKHGKIYKYSWYANYRFLPYPLETWNTWNCFVFFKCNSPFPKEFWSVLSGPAVIIFVYTTEGVDFWL